MRLTFAKNDILFSEGDASDFVYRLVHGQAEALRGASAESVGHIETGDFIGEIGVLVGTPRGATIRFTAESTVERYERTEFLELLATDDELRMRLMHVLSLRTRSLMERIGQVEAPVSGIARLLPGAVEPRPLTSRLAGMPLVAVRALALLVRGVVAAVLEPVRRAAKRLPAGAGDAGQPAQDLATLELSPGDVVFREGDASRHVFRVRTGSVQVYKRGPHGEIVIGRLGAGAFVGEMGVLESAPRSAGARAATHAVLETLSPEEFDELMRRSPEQCFGVLEALCERARELAEALRAQAPGDDRDEPIHAIYEMITQIESVAQLAEQRLAGDLAKARRFFQTQADHGAEMIRIYQRYLRGEASTGEMERANAHFRDYLKMAGLGTLLILPGAVLTIPLAVKVGKSIGIDILPRSHDRKGDSTTP